MVDSIIISIFTSVTKHIEQMERRTEYYRELSTELKDKRIRCIEMKDDPLPIESGSMGTVVYVDDMGTIHIKWDNGRTLGLIHGMDRYEIVG